MALPLPDGRVVVARWQPRHRPFGLLGALGLLAIAIALGAYPIVRRITRRLERLQTRVEALGAGDLTVRVEVEGHDEVAQLARSFNHAADRIERLVNAQRTMLAGASHELRSPLARIRMAIELLPSADRPELQARLTQDIAELDTLIGELLLASRLDTLGAPGAYRRRRSARPACRGGRTYRGRGQWRTCLYPGRPAHAASAPAQPLRERSALRCWLACRGLGATPRPDWSTSLHCRPRARGARTGAGTYLCPLLPSYQHA